MQTGKPSSVFFTSDNGWQHGEHRIHFGKNRTYEESAREPLFVRGPEVPAGSRFENLAVNTDFAPTFAELAGVDFPADGRSLLPLLRGEEPLSWRSAVLLEMLPAEEGGEAKGKEGETGAGGVPKTGVGGSPPFWAVRTETYKYVVEYDNGERELHNLRTDPYELENIYEAADSSLVEDLKGRLEALRDCSGAGCREAEDTS
jgi:arylsulfatase A-like enzyme